MRWRWIRRLWASPRRQARRALRMMFQDPALLRGTSLRPKHATYALLLDFEATEERVSWLEFGIVRHPKPYPFSPQFHEVLEYWRYEVTAGRVERIDSVNLSRRRGTDGEFPLHP